MGRKTDGQKDRWAERQTKTDGQKDRMPERQTYKYTVRHTERRTNRLTDRHIYAQTDITIEGQSGS
jgi:hypothetical protein